MVIFLSRQTEEELCPFKNVRFRSVSQKKIDKFAFFLEFLFYATFAL